MHALSLCFISAACFSAFIAVPTNAENFKPFLHLLDNKEERVQSNQIYECLQLVFHILRS